MPSAPPRACRCGAIVPKGQRCRRCEAERDRQRGTSTERGYDASWRQIRGRFLRSHPMCAWPGCGSYAKEVDHIEPIALRPDLRLSWHNLRSLCKAHHSQRTAQDQHQARRAAEGRKP
jgi:5-methylcytosine-specific restriction protein A